MIQCSVRVEAGCARPGAREDMWDADDDEGGKEGDAEECGGCGGPGVQVWWCHGCEMGWVAEESSMLPGHFKADVEAEDYSRSWEVCSFL